MGPTKICPSDLPPHTDERFAARACMSVGAIGRRRCALDSVWASGRIDGRNRAVEVVAR